MLDNRQCPENKQCKTIDKLFYFRYVEHFKEIILSGQRDGMITENVLTPIKVYSCIQSIYIVLLPYTFCVTLFKVQHVKSALSLF
jgi:hypothetical protein